MYEDVLDRECSLEKKFIRWARKAVLAEFAAMGNDYDALAEILDLSPSGADNFLCHLKWSLEDAFRACSALGIDLTFVYCADNNPHKRKNHERL